MSKQGEKVASEPKEIEGVDYWRIIHAVQLAFMNIEDEAASLKVSRGRNVKTPKENTFLDARLYLLVLLNGFNQSNEKIAKQINMHKDEKKTSSVSVGKRLKGISERGFMFEIPEGNANRYYPINPSILLSYASHVAKSEGNVSLSCHSIAEIVKNLNMEPIRLILQDKWNIFLEKSLEIEMSLRTSHENAAWLNFCGWIDAFKVNNICINFFSADLILISNSFRKDILKLALNDFKGSFNIYTVEARGNELKDYAKDFLNEYPDVVFNGYVVSEHSFFNKYYRVATFGDILGTVTLKHGSKYSGTLFYKKTDHINYINKCFDSMQEGKI